MALQIPERRTNYYWFSADKKRDFLIALADLGRVDLACERIRVRRRHVDEARCNDLNFRDAWADAIAHAFSKRVNDVAPRGAR